MEWQHHPRFKHPVERMMRLLFPSGEVPLSRKTPMVFLCGGADRSRREELAAYLREHHGTRLGVFFAEDVWSRVSSLDEGANALEVEERLADAADLIIIVLESPGAIAELGAFSSHDRLRKKILPIIETKHARSNSFINTGPIHWVNQESRYGPALESHFSPISVCFANLEDRLERLPRYMFHRDSHFDAHAVKHAVSLVADLVALLGPVSSGYITSVAKRLHFELPPGWTIDAVVSLCVSMRLAIEWHFVGSVALYTRVFDPGTLGTRFRASDTQICRARSRIVFGLQKIPEAWAQLCQIADESAA